MLTISYPLSLSTKPSPFPSFFFPRQPSPSSSSYFAMFSLFAAVVLALPFTQAAFVPRHDHAERGNLPSAWHQSDDSPVHALFKRQSGIPTDGITYAPVGSAAWAKGFPNPDANINTATLPQEWVDALNAYVFR